MNDMHDYVFIGFSYLWGEGELTLSFTGRDSVDFIVEYYGVSHLSMTHANEWGPSSSVNLITEAVDVGADMFVVLEIQSGDKLSFRCAGKKKLL